MKRRNNRKWALPLRIDYEETFLLTMMVQMVPYLHVAMSSGCDMEIPLHFVALQASVYPATSAFTPKSRCFGPFPPSSRPADFAHDVRCMTVVFDALLPSSASLIKFVLQFVSSTTVVYPVAPRCVIFRQHITSKDTIARCILDVDVYIGTVHGEDYVEVDLKVMRNTFFDGEAIDRDWVPPPRNL